MYLYWQIKDCSDLPGCCDGTHRTRMQVHGCRRGTVLFLLKWNRSCEFKNNIPLMWPVGVEPTCSDPHSDGLTAILWPQYLLWDLNPTSLAWEASILTFRLRRHKRSQRDLNPASLAWKASVLPFRLWDHSTHIRTRTWIYRFYAPLRSVQVNRPPDDLNRSRLFYPLNYTSFLWGILLDASFFYSCTDLYLGIYINNDDLIHGYIKNGC